MASYNKVILVGNLTRDPQLRYLPSQMAVVEFGLAVSHKYRTAQGEDREEVCFIDCNAFGKLGETINKYCQKGKLLLVEGRLKFDTWEDKESGGKRSKHRVTVEGFQFLGGRPDGGGAPPAEEVEAPPRQQQRPAGAKPPQGRPAPQQQEPPISNEEHFKEDDIPF